MPQNNSFSNLILWPKNQQYKRDLKRRKLIAKYASKRAELKAILANPETSDEDFYKAQGKLSKLQRIAHRSAHAIVVPITGRPRAHIRKFGLSRITFRELASKGKIHGVTKSSW